MISFTMIEKQNIENNSLLSQMPAKTRFAFRLKRKGKVKNRLSTV